MSNFFVPFGAVDIHIYISIRVQGCMVGGSMTFHVVHQHFSSQIQGLWTLESFKCFCLWARIPIRPNKVYK